MATVFGSHPSFRAYTTLDSISYRYVRRGFLSRFAHGGAVLYDVRGQLAGALHDVTFQDPTRSLSRYTGVYARDGSEMLG